MYAWFSYMFYHRSGMLTRPAGHEAVDEDKGPPTLRSICPIGAPKVQMVKQLLRSISAAQEQIVFKFHKMVLHGTMEAAELSTPTKGRIQDGRQCTNF